MRRTLRKSLIVGEPRRDSARNAAPSENEVMVLFDAAALTFPIPVGSTLADLAMYLAKISARQRRRVVCVAVKLRRNAMKPQHGPDTLDVHG
jgi:hypothetical protein